MGTRQSKKRLTFDCPPGRLSERIVVGVLFATARPFKPQRENRFEFGLADVPGLEEEVKKSVPVPVMTSVGAVAHQ